MLAQVRSGAVVGVECVPVRVEVDAADGLPSISVVGLAQGAVREGRDRVRAAIVHSGFDVPPRRYTVNFAPADLPKDGSALDLPLALGFLRALGKVPEAALAGHAFVGELGLDGDLRPIRGALAIARRCAHDGVRTLVVPRENGPEAAAADPGLDVRTAGSLRAVVAHLEGREGLPRAESPGHLHPQANGAGDLRDVRGHESAKRALEVTAAGGHNILFIGSPGSGKTMLARRLPGILPPLEREEALDVTTVHSVAGLLAGRDGLIRERPFRAPHHTVSRAGLAGGGTPVRPGELTLAHCGILFLDELPEFNRGALESLRQPLEAGHITLVRARERVTFPARFTLVAAMNPCPCGRLGDPVRPCECDPGKVARYRHRVSGPLRDRIDLHLQVAPVAFDELVGAGRGESSRAVRDRVIRARRMQRDRFVVGRRGAPTLNAHMEAPDVHRFAHPERAARGLLEAASDRLGLSSRAVHRILKGARTIADLEGAHGVARSHVAEALQYRVLDRRIP